MLLFFLLIKELNVIYNTREKFILNLRQDYLHIYYNILYSPPMYTCYINKVNIQNRIPFNQQAYHYYDVVM